MRITLLTLILLVYHPVLALPAPSVERSELQASPISSIEEAYEVSTPQALDSRSPSHDKVITNLDTRRLQARQLPWVSTRLDAKVSVLVNTAVATGLQIANGWLEWQFSLVYNQDSRTFGGTIDTTAIASASDVSVCVNEYTPQRYGNTGGTLWSEGPIVLEASLRSVHLSESITIFWQGTVRFYQQTTIGKQLASTILNTIGNAWGYKLKYDENWVCTTKVQDKPMIDILQTQFVSCNEGQNS
jgi:hypothetical protein